MTILGLENHLIMRTAAMKYHPYTSRIKLKPVVLKGVP
jgi:hypothetical protein